MSSEEDDYMSEDFIKNLERQDVRPGLIWSQSQKRKLEADKKKALCDTKPLKVQEEEAREAGLSKPIDPSNKGHQLLVKMGFTGNLGKTNSANGLKEPIQVTLKSNRLGVGMETKKTPKKFKVDEGTMKMFSETQKNSLSSRHLKYDLTLSRQSCYNLDSENDVTIPQKEYFWPYKVMEALRPKETELDEKEEYEEPSVEEMYDQLKTLTIYLRQKYFYCVWCGTKFDNLEDMEQSCPGPSREIHDE